MQHEQHRPGTAGMPNWIPVSPERELRARVLAVSLCAMLAEYAASEGRPRLLSESLRGIGRAAAP